MKVIKILLILIIVAVLGAGGYYGANLYMKNRALKTINKIITAKINTMLKHWKKSTRMCPHHHPEAFCTGILIFLASLTRNLHPNPWHKR